MPTSKLTLSADKAVIADVKRLAATRHTSVSALFERLLGSLTAPRVDTSQALGPITRRASGIIRWPKGRTDRQLLEESFSDKYKPRA